MKTLEEVIREQIGAEGPKCLTNTEYDQYVEEQLENMSAKRLLELLSYTIDWSKLL